MAAIAVVFLVAPLLVAIVDIVLVLLLAVLGVAGRVLLRRPWTVEARSDDGERLVWRVVGWRASGEHVARVAELLAAGMTPPRDEAAEAT